MSVLSSLRLLISSAIISLPIVSLAAVSVDTSVAENTQISTHKEVVPPLTTTEPQESPLVNEASSRPLNIAMLMPADESPFLSAAKIVGNGLIAANRVNNHNANLMLIEAPENVNIHELLDAAVFAGADVVIGPLQKDRVEHLANAEQLPIPVVTLNYSQLAAQHTASNLIMLSVATDLEAEYIAKLAIQALPQSTSLEHPSKVLVLTTDKAWEKRLSEAYVRVLQEANIPHEVFTVTLDNLQELQDKCRPELSAEERMKFRRMEIAAGSDKKALKEIQNEAKTKMATGEPPFHAALLALDAGTAGLVRSRLPLRTRVWATSTTNPGDPSTSSSSSALAYDLNQVVFAECPLILRYDAQSFEKKYHIAMPYSMPARRLFSLGLDAYQVAIDWAKNTKNFQIKGETGNLTVDRSLGALVERHPSTYVIHNGTLVDVPTEILVVPGDFPALPSASEEESQEKTNEPTAEQNN